MVVGVTSHVREVSGGRATDAVSSRAYTASAMRTHPTTRSVGVPNAIFIGAAVLWAACGDSGSSTMATSAGAAGAGGHGGVANSGVGQGGGAAAGGGVGHSGQGGNTASGAGGGGGGAPNWVATLRPLSLRHRFIDGAMFGGWGPHLGHLLRTDKSNDVGSTLWFVDDYCAQNVADGLQCNVNDDHSLGYFELDGGVWTERQVISLPGTVQQNTASLVADDGTLYSYGLDVAGGVIHQCSYAPKAGPEGCSALPFSTGANANYIGAAISPQGYRLVWWTQVMDGGGGAFHYIIDYGGGFNGPRSGGVDGYNDASYVNIAFGGTSANAFTMHVQLVSGVAPNWSFFGAVGYGDMSDTSPVAWSNALAPPANTAVSSTNDVWTDAATGDTHLLARLESGAAAYYHRPAGGAWSAASFVQPAAYRARWVVVAGRLAMVYGQPNDELQVRIADLASQSAGVPIDWETLSPETVTLPSDFGKVYAIYPESPAYQNAAASSIEVALVGATQQYSVTHLSLSPR